jgi:hypothetical protein
MFVIKKIHSNREKNYFHNIKILKFTFGYHRGGGRISCFVLFVMFLEIGFALW